MNTFEEFKINDKFSSFLELQEAIKLYETRTHLKLNIKRSTRINSMKNIPNTISISQIQRLEFSYIRYSCEFGSRRSTKALIRQTSSKKINCPFQIKIKSNKSSLILTDIVDHSDHFQGRYSKPPIESDVKEDIEKFKEVKAKNVHVAQYVSKKSKITIQQRILEIH